MRYRIRQMSQRQEHSQFIGRMVEGQRPSQLRNIKFCLISILGFNLEKFFRLTVINDLRACIEDDEIPISGGNSMPAFPQDRGMKNQRARKECGKEQFVKYSARVILRHGVSPWL